MKKFIIIGFIFSQLGLFFTAHSQEKPNIILIMLDDLGYGDPGCYGQQMIKTPNMDALATEGMKFTNYYSGSAVCAPSREVLLTGRHTGHTFVRGNFQTDKQENVPLPSESITIAEALKGAGYQTIMLGKWGLGGPENGPEKHGFDYFYGYLDQIEAHNYYPPHLYENGKKIMIPENADGKTAVYSHHLFANKTMEFLDTAGKEPFFMYLPYTIPHGKHVIPDNSQYASYDWKPNLKNYAAMISLVDADLGRIIDKLKEKGLTENTIVILTSDNGANPGFAKFFKSNGIFRGSKREFYEGGIRVPLIVSWPGKIQSGQVSNHLSAAWDILPTICEFGKSELPAKVDGLSIVPTLLNTGKQQEHDCLYWEEFPYNYDWKKDDNILPRNYLNAQAIRMGKWKALRNNIYTKKNNSIELYNIEEDPSEEKNLADKFPEIVKQAEGIMKTARTTDAPYFPYQPY